MALPLGAVREGRRRGYMQSILSREDWKPGTSSESLFSLISRLKGILRAVVTVLAEQLGRASSWPGAEPGCARRVGEGRMDGDQSGEGYWSWEEHPGPMWKDRPLSPPRAQRSGPGGQVANEAGRPCGFPGPGTSQAQLKHVSRSGCPLPLPFPNPPTHRQAEGEVPGEVLTFGFRVSPPA